MIFAYFLKGYNTKQYSAIIQSLCCYVQMTGGPEQLVCAKSMLTKIKKI